MRHRFPSMCIGLLTALSLVEAAAAAAEDERSASSIQAPSQAGAPLDVDELMKNVDQHRGRIQLVGVVSAVAADKTSLTLIDVSEYANCGKTSCALLKLPVRWSGSMPAVKDIVRLEGEVRDDAGKLLFVAARLERVLSTPQVSK